MTTRIIVNTADRDELFALIKSVKLPITVNVKKGKDRSVEQNKLQRLWLSEAVEQLQDETIEQKRGYCKLHFGVPIMRNEDDEFKLAYDKVIRPLPYELKIMAMMLPLDFPVTRIMKSGQKKRYLDDVWYHFSGLGVKLTDPNEQGE